MFVLLKTWLLTAPCLIAMGTDLVSAGEVRLSFRPVDSRIAVESSTKSTEKIERLIDELGSDNYAIRRAAEQQLIDMSQAAFDHLLAAQDHEDLEIASQALYLLHRLPIAWVSVDDSDSVRTLMDNYSRNSHRERRQVIKKLFDLPNDDGLQALVRISRFESSPLLARHAAIAILSAHQELVENDKIDNRSKLSPQILAQLAESRREPTEWLRLYFEYANDGQYTPEPWLAAIDRELSLLEEDDPNTDRTVAASLLDFHLEFSARLEHSHAAFESLRRITDLRISNRFPPRNSIGKSLEWILNSEQWMVLERFEKHYADTIHGDPELLYMIAAARSKQGSEGEAETLAEEAFALQEGEPRERLLIADKIAELGYHDWAEREWQHLVDTLPLTSNESLYARRQLVVYRLHDRDEHWAAAELLGEVVDAVDTDPEVKRQVFSDSISRSLLKAIRSQREYFLACHFQDLGDVDQQKEHLERAHQLDPDDPDVLIAMYRLPNQSDEYRERVSARIRKARETVQQNIDQTPEVSHWYNHWAWLVSNTEGDYQQAVKYSLHSLELQPGSPSYLDTLGRCYYAVGDLENAIKFQRQAVEKHPQVQVLKKQLELFETTLTAQQDHSGDLSADQP